MGPLDGKVAPVVGGTRGIGAADGRRMVAEGASVAIIDLSRRAEAGAFAKGLRERGGDVLP